MTVVRTKCRFLRSADPGLARDMPLSQSRVRRIASDDTLCTDMNQYEIRILKENGQQLVIEVRLMGDHAAIRRARTLATDTDRVEVWRGMTCVYSTAEWVAVH